MLQSRHNATPAHRSRTTPGAPTPRLDDGSPGRQEQVKVPRKVNSLASAARRCATPQFTGSAALLRRTLLGSGGESPERRQLLPSTRQGLAQLTPSSTHSCPTSPDVCPCECVPVNRAATFEACLPRTIE